jgi:hypothetical protein
LVAESILKIKDDIQDSSSSSFHTCSNHNNSRQLPSNGGTPCSNSNRSVSRSNGGSSGDSGLGGRQRGKYRKESGVYLLFPSSYLSDFTGIEGEIL